jgi:hypothetical protein
VNCDWRRDVSRLGVSSIRDGTTVPRKESTMKVKYALVYSSIPLVPAPRTTSTGRGSSFETAVKDAGQLVPELLAAKSSVPE